MVQAKSFKHILVAVDGSAQGQMALKNAIHQSNEDDSRLTILSIFEQGDLSAFDALNKDKVQINQNEILENLEKWKKMAQDEGVKNVKTVYAEGRPGEVIVEDTIPVFKPDLVIIGAHSREAGQKWFGSVASYVAKNASVSVLVIR